MVTLAGASSLYLLVVEQVEGQMDRDWEDQRSELIDGLLSTSSPCQLATQEAVSVLLYMAQDDSSASGSGAESPQVGPQPSFHQPSPA